MDSNIDDIAKIVTIAKPFIDPIISTLIKPSIDKLSAWLKNKDIEDKVLDNFFESKFVDYLSVTLTKCQSINLLIFQNQQIKIDAIYFPLTIVSNKDRSRYKIEKFSRELFENVGKALISDTAGMGKSTLSKWLCKTCIEENVAIPLLIELRNLSEEFTILDEIFSQFNPIGNDFDRDLILKFIELGNFLIILDGFDEIQLKSQEVIIKNIREFIDKANKNWFLLTSRPEGSLSAFGDFQHFSIVPLKGNEPYDLIKKYDSIAIVKISDRLIKDIEEKYNQVGELLGNPFLVSLLYSTYTYNKDIPSSKLSFYEELYSALFKRHDLSKDGWTRPKKSNLDIQQFRIVLRQLAFDTSLLGETNYSETKLTNLVDEALSKCPGINTKPYDFIEDILLTVPLFQRDGFKIKWAHKSIQDFFASEYIAYDNKKEEFLNIIYDTNTESFNNILEFIIESDFKSFRKTIINKLLTDYIKHYQTQYSNIFFQKYISLELRKAKSFGIKYLLKNSDDNDDYEDLFNKIESLHPEIKSDQNRGIYVLGNNCEVIIIAGLKIAIMDMIYNKGLNYVKTFHVESTNNKKFSLPKKGIIEVNDDPESKLNNKNNFDKVTYFLPHPGSRVKDFLTFIYIDYTEAEEELEKIRADIDAERSNFSISYLLKGAIKS